MLKVVQDVGGCGAAAQMGNSRYHERRAFWRATLTVYYYCAIASRSRSKSGSFGGWQSGALNKHPSSNSERDECMCRVDQSYFSRQQPEENVKTMK